LKGESSINVQRVAPTQRCGAVYTENQVIFLSSNFRRLVKSVVAMEPTDDKDVGR